MKFVFPGGGLFGAPAAPALPPPPPPIPDETDAQVKAKKDQARIDAQRRKGLLSTNLTSGGLNDSDANTDRKTLLGQ
jgi:hypothetical protein